MLKVEYLAGMPSWPQFADMFGGWLVNYDGRTFMIDCGVKTGATSLVEKMKERTKHLDYLVLTHIHMDHAGGASEIIKAFPDVKVLAHDKGLPHLINPDKLWEGTKQVMGEVASVYGRPEPLAAERLISHKNASIEGLEVFETPGHAPHHLSFSLGGTYFVGEAGGCPLMINGCIHNRPATPPRYFPNIMLRSIDLLLTLPEAPAYFAHTSECLPFHETLCLYKRQLLLWDSILRRPELARMGEPKAVWLDRLADELFNEDPNLRPFNSYPADDLWRERYFIKNSIDGFISHYAEENKKQA